MLDRRDREDRVKEVQVEVEVEGGGFIACGGFPVGKREIGRSPNRSNRNVEDDSCQMIRAIGHPGMVVSSSTSAPVAQMVLARAVRLASWSGVLPEFQCASELDADGVVVEPSVVWVVGRGSG